MPRHDLRQLPPVFRDNLCADTTHVVIPPVRRHRLRANVCRAQMPTTRPDMPPASSWHGTAQHRGALAKLGALTSPRGTQHSSFQQNGSFIFNNVTLPLTISFFSIARYKENLGSP